jgi:hypothetical protein
MNRLGRIAATFSLFLLGSLAIVPKAFAACSTGGGGIDLRECFLLGTNDRTVTSVYSQPSVLINLIVRNVFILAGIIFFFVILYAGFQYISGGKKGAEQAKTILTTAILGFVIMFSAYWILQILRIITGIGSIFQF